MLPDYLREILKSNQVCCLGTLNGDEPYLSLMFFSLDAKEDILIMSSRKDSTKIDNLKSNPRAAVLISTENRNQAITLSGSVQLAEGERAEKYRLIHQQNHPMQAPFISDQAAIIVFKPLRAVISDPEDHVTYWQEKQ